MYSGIASFLSPRPWLLTLASPRSIVSVSGTINLLFPHTQSISIYYFTGWNTGFYFTRNLTAIYVINKFIQGLLHRFLFSRFTNLNVITILRAPDKLRICVFYAMKTSKNACIIRSECTFTHTYCCVSKLSKFGAYLYAVDDNTSCT